MTILKNEENPALNKAEEGGQQQQQSQPKENQQFTPYRSFDRYGEELLQATNRHVVDFLS